MTTEPKQPTPVTAPYQYIFQPDDIIAARYKVIKPIGYGGFSEVYHCEDIELSREVAVKVLIKGEGGLKEARAAAKLKHKNIVEVLDVDNRSGGHPIIVFEYLSGSTLEQRLAEAQHRRLPLDNVLLKITREIAEALDYAHAKGIIHRDVKPSNVIIDSNGDAHLTDFGLAEVKLTDEQRQLGSAMTTDIQQRLSGTIPYMSPEQLRDGQPGDEKSDLYSLAVLTYEMLTGRYPYPGREAMLMIQIATDPPQPPTTINPDLPKGVEPVLLKALSKKPDERFASCTEFAVNLTNAAEAYIRANTQYIEAVKLVNDRDWRKASSALEALNASAPNFKDTDKYLEIVRRQVQLLDQYERASQQVDQGAFLEAIATLNFLAQLDRTYDVAALKKRAEAGQAKIERATLDDQYRQAVELYERQEYEACANVLDTIYKRDPQYPDDRNIKVDAAARVASIRERRELYAKGLDQVSHEQWEAAVITFNLLRQKDPKYPGVEHQLAAARQLAKLSSLWREAQDLQTQGQYAASVDKVRDLRGKDDSYKPEETAVLEQDGLNRLHDQIVLQLSTGQYQASLATLAELQKRTDQFTDLDDLRAQADEGIRKQQLRTSLDESYQQAQACLKRYDYQGALVLWQSIQDRREDLDYADPQDVAGQARRGLANSLYNAAVAALAEGDVQQALASWQKVQEVEPDYPDNQRIVQRAKALNDKIAADQLRERDRVVREAAERDRLAREAAEQRTQRNKRLIIAAGIIGGIILLLLLGWLLVNALNNAASAPTPTPSATHAATHTATAPTAAPSLTPTAATEPTMTPTFTPEPPAPPTLAPTPDTAIQPNIALAGQPSTIYSSPSVNSRELAFVQVGAPVTVTGRSDSGSWLYVQAAGGIEGYVAADRFQYTGDVNTLPIVNNTGSGGGTGTVKPSATPTIPKNLEGLTLDLWTLPETAQCLPEGKWSVSIFMSGHGGYGVYTYFWNGQQMGGPTSERITFDLTATGNRVEGIGSVTSGGLQTQRTLIVRPPSCP
jgi:serine/threonine protein kinase